MSPFQSLLFVGSTTKLETTCEPKPPTRFHTDDHSVCDISVGGRLRGPPSPQVTRIEPPTVQMEGNENVKHLQERDGDFSLSSFNPPAHDSMSPLFVFGLWY